MRSSERSTGYLTSLIFASPVIVYLLVIMYALLNVAVELLFGFDIGSSLLILPTD